MLTGSTEEVGTDRPTIRDPYAQQRLAELKQRDPAFSEQAIQTRVGLIFQTMQYAWSSLEWQRARPFLSDMLFETQSYWISAYRAQGLRNITEKARITSLELVRVSSDRWFDSVTLRIRATGLDYTIRDSDNCVVGGSRSKEREYSEYWTLIRGTNRLGPSRVDTGCPNCGAPLVVNMAAICSHCGAKVNSGAFDWVLSRIEQDESYEG